MLTRITSLFSRFFRYKFVKEIRIMKKEMPIYLKDEFYIYPEDVEKQNININPLNLENYAKKS